MAEPGQLEQFAALHLGQVEVLDEQRSYAAQSTLHVRDRTGADWYVKQAGGQLGWAAEVGAYAAWSHHHAVGELRAVDEDAWLLLVSGCPGWQPRNARPRVMRSAGRTLRQLHDAPVEAGWWSSDWREHLPWRLETVLERLAAMEVEVDGGFLRAMVDQALSTSLPETLTHGDYLPRNWRWSPEGGFHVFDFGAAGLRPAAFDLSRVRYWFGDRPLAMTRLMAGYGRELSEEEERLATALMPWRAVISLEIGLRCGWDHLVVRARQVLEESRSLAVGQPATTRSVASDGSAA